MPFMYLHQPDAPPQRRVYNKLIAAGWINPVVTEQQEGGNMLVGIQCTPEGAPRLLALATFFEEIEKASWRLEADELPHLKAVAEFVLMTASLPPRPPA